MKFDESFGDIRELKERIAEGIARQHSNDPLPSMLLGNDYGKITLQLIQDHFQFFFHPKHPILPKNPDVSGSVSVISEMFYKKNDERIPLPARIHESILKHLEMFQNEKAFLGQYGFQCLGYNWYENGDFQILKISHEGGVHFYFDGTYFDEGQTVMDAVRNYSKDLGRYSTLPRELRDWIANEKP